MDSYEEAARRDAAMARIVAALNELDDTIRDIVESCPDAQLRVDLRQIMLGVQDVRATSRRYTSWWLRPLDSYARP